MEDYKKEISLDSVEIKPCIVCGKSSMTQIARVNSLFFANFTYMVLRCENSECNNHAWVMIDRAKHLDYKDGAEESALKESIMQVVIGKKPKPLRRLLTTYSSPKQSYLELPKNIFHHFDQAYKCLMAGYYDASTCLFRRTLENVLIDKGANPKDRLIDMIRKLEDNGQLPVEATQLCEDIKCWGNKGAHSNAPIAAKDADLACMFSDILVAWLYGHIRPSVQNQSQ